MIEIIPAIMPSSFADLEDKLAAVAPHVPFVQIDIMDGVFVRSKSWPYNGDKASFEALLHEDTGMPFWDTLDFEVDLMVAHPETVIDDWITAGASRLIIHVESTNKIGAIVKDIRARFAYPIDNVKPDLELGLALNPSTPTDMILPYLEDINFVQFMGIEKIGYQGEPFSDTVIDKIREFHNAHPEVIISIDGGVNLDNARDLIEAGAKRLVSGSAIFESENILGTLEEFKHLTH